MSSRNPIARSLRILRLIGHLLRGLWITHRHFPKLSAEARTVHIKIWSQHLLSICDITLKTNGQLTAPALVSNHISWLDIFAINAITPVSFIAKQELSTWPLVGRLLTSVGTQFIDRQKRSDISRINNILHACIAAKQPLAFFPEGTTADGKVLKPFKSSLFQPLIEGGVTCHIISLSYRTARGDLAERMAFVGDLTFLGSLWQGLGEVGTVVEVDILNTLDCAGANRKDLCAEAERLIGQSVRH